MAVASFSITRKLWIGGFMLLVNRNVVVMSSQEVRLANEAK